MAWESDGTVTVTNGTKIVTGSGTSWFGSLQTGWGFVGPDGRVYEIDTIDSATQITLKTNYQGSSGGSQVYSCFPTLSLTNDLVTSLQTLIGNYQGVYDGIGQGKFPNGTVALPAVRAEGDPDTGIYFPSANQMAAVTGGVRRWLLSNTAMQVDVPITGTALQANATDVTAGKLLTVGAFGLGDDDGAPVLTDLDDHNIPNGFYRATNANAGTQPPVSSTVGAVISWKPSFNQSTQLYSNPNANGKTYIRKSTANTGWDTWREIYTQASILGTVSQSAGVPTGALIESGSNANGRYRRFACGMQECWRDDLSVADINTAIGASGLYRSTAAITWTFPAAFLTGSNPTVAGQGSQVSQWLAPGGAEATSVNLNAVSYTQQATAQTVRARAVGRWF